ncbi:MAG: hypothetical protein AAF797_03735 [Planctomycetota bacterium]
MSPRGPWAASPDKRFAYTLENWYVFGTEHSTVRQHSRLTGSVLAGTAVTHRSTVQYNAAYFGFVYDTKDVELYDGWKWWWPVYRGVGWVRKPYSYSAAKPHPVLPPIGDVRVYYSHRWPFLRHGRPVEPIPNVILELPDATTAQARRDFEDSSFVVRVINHETRKCTTTRFGWMDRGEGRFALRSNETKPGVMFLWSFFTKGQQGKPRGVTLEFYAVSSEDGKAGSYKSGKRFYTARVPSLPEWTIQRVESFFEQQP